MNRAVREVCVHVRCEWTSESEGACVSATVNEWKSKESEAGNSSRRAINVQYRLQFRCGIKVTAPQDTAKLPGIILSV